jgi:hypothetical protein
VYLAAGPQGLPDWGLSVYARGRCHLTGSPRGMECSTEGLSGVSAFRFSERAPAVGGHRAFWADSSLVWQYARGGWAALSWPGSAPGVRTPRHETVMRHREAIKIAEHVRFGAYRGCCQFRRAGRVRGGRGGTALFVVFGVAGGVRVGVRRMCRASVISSGACRVA